MRNIYISIFALLAILCGELHASMKVQRVDDSDFDEIIPSRNTEFARPLLKSAKEVIDDRWAVLTGRCEYFMVSEDQEIEKPIFNVCELQKAIAKTNNDHSLIFENFKWSVQAMGFKSKLTYPDFNQEMSNFLENVGTIFWWSLPKVSNYQMIPEFDTQIKYENEAGEQCCIALRFTKLIERQIEIQPKRSKKRRQSLPT
jgi:hypothetical protein